MGGGIDELDSNVPDPRVTALIEEANRCEDNTGIGTIVEDIFKILMESGLAWEDIHILQQQVCVHKENRYGLGMIVKRVHKLGRKIMKIGFLWNACEMVICIQEPDSKENVTFTIDLQSKSEGFARQQAHTITHASLGGGHLNQLLCCIAQGVPCDYPELCINGKMSLAKISSKCAEYGDAVRCGLK